MELINGSDRKSFGFSVGESAGTRYVLILTFGPTNSTVYKRCCCIMMGNDVFIIACRLYGKHEVLKLTKLQLN